MGTSDRALSRGSRRTARLLQDYAAEVREARLSAGMSQRELGRRAGISATKLGLIESGRLQTLSIADATTLAAVLGLDLVLRTYPYGPKLRDEAQVRRLATLLAHVTPPLAYRTEAPLPQRTDAVPELRAWDALILGHGFRTAIEVEMRLRDAQQLERRVTAKRRDDPVDGFLLVIADTPVNRRVLAEHPALFADLPRLKRRRVLNALHAGVHPPNGLVLL